MEKDLLKINLRVEYSAKVRFYDENGNVQRESRHCVGYVKRVFRSWFRDYALICECKSHRLDKVPVKNIIGEVKNRNAKTGRFEKINIVERQNKKGNGNV